MFARVINFKIKPGTGDEMRKITEQRAISWLQGQKGFHRMHLVQLSDTELMSFEVWDDKESAEAARPEGERLAQQLLGHLLADAPSFGGGNIIAHGATHEIRIHHHHPRGHR